MGASRSAAAVFISLSVLISISAGSLLPVSQGESDREALSMAAGRIRRGWGEAPVPFETFPKKA